MLCHHFFFEGGSVAGFGADSVVLLRYFEALGTVRRAISIMRLSGLAAGVAPESAAGGSAA